MPSRPFASITPSLSAEYVRKLNAVTYLGIVCVVLVLKRRLSPFYVTNLANEDFPFTGIIEMTNLISGEETEGRHLVYLPKYTSPGDPLFDASDDEVWAIVPEMETGVPGLILANTTQIINSTLNNNAMVKIARQAVEMALKPSAGGCAQPDEAHATVA
jgi:hypothetical protein